MKLFQKKGPVHVPHTGSLDSLRQSEALLQARHPCPQSCVLTRDGAGALPAPRVLGLLAYTRQVSAADQGVPQQCLGSPSSSRLLGGTGRKLPAAPVVTHSPSIFANVLCHAPLCPALRATPALGSDVQGGGRGRGMQVGSTKGVRWAAPEDPFALAQPLISPTQVSSFCRHPWSCCRANA